MPEYCEWIGMIKFIGLMLMKQASDNRSFKSRPKIISLKATNLFEKKFKKMPVGANLPN